MVSPTLKVKLGSLTDILPFLSDSKGGLKVPEYTAENDLVHRNGAGYKEMERIILSSLKL